MNEKLNFADIFSGCGGFTNGFYGTKSFHGILATDWWRIAGNVFQENYPDMKFELLDLFDENNIKKIINAIPPDLDILLGGPPCQGFSTLGKRKDNDKRNSLIDTFLEICEGVKPKLIIIENVSGIRSKKHQNGFTYPEYVENNLNHQLSDTRYCVRTISLNALDYGLAQTRRRWFLFAIRMDLPDPIGLLDKVLINIENQKVEKARVLRDVIGDLPPIESGEGNEVIEYYKNRKKIVVFNHRSLNHSKQLVERFSFVPPGGGLQNVPRHLLKTHLQRMQEGIYGNGGHTKNIYGRLEWDKPCGTIVAGIDKITCGRFVHPEANRLLTPRECARIQSFPDSFRFNGGLVNQYYLIGNAVPPAISKIIANAIQKEKKNLKH
jgi:DNA (cytosine-5)-methyltransferase 1